MPNMPRKEGHPEKYADRTLLDYGEAQDYLGIRRSTLYSYVTDLDIETKKFKRDRKRYLRIEDVNLIKKIMETPGMYEEILRQRYAGNPDILATIRPDEIIPGKNEPALA